VFTRESRPGKTWKNVMIYQDDEMFFVQREKSGTQISLDKDNKNKLP